MNGWVPCFFGGVWNTPHIADVENILKNNYESSYAMYVAIAAIKVDNPHGTLAFIQFFLEEMVDNIPIKVNILKLV